MMRKLYQEICVRFPEVSGRTHRGDEELPYQMMSHLVDWLKSLPKSADTPEVVARVLAFTTWCENQPPGCTADDDIYTLLVVGFYEKVFESEPLRPLLPKLISKKALIRNAGYWCHWIGKEHYDKAVNSFH